MGGKLPGWPGHMTYEALWGGRGGGLVRLGDYLVPRKVTAIYDGDKGTPDLRARYEVRDGVPVCTEYAVTAKPDGRPVTAADMVKFPVDVLGVQAVMFHASPVAKDYVGPFDLLDPATTNEQHEVAGAIDKARETPRERANLAELREVARVYDEHPEAPVKAVMETLEYKQRTATRRVAAMKQARAEGRI